MTTSTQHQQNIDQPTAKQHFARAFDFVQSLENVLCVYTESADKIYIDYQARETKSVIAPETEQSLVVLPKSPKYPHVVCDISNNAVVATDIRVIAGESIGKIGPHLSGIPKGQTTPTTLPLLMGIAAMQQGYYEGGPMLPVVTYKDLREAPSRATPFAQIHAVKLDSLTEKSLKDLEKIERLMVNKTKAVMRFFTKFNVAEQTIAAHSTVDVSNKTYCVEDRKIEEKTAKIAKLKQIFRDAKRCNEESQEANAQIVAN